MKKLAVLGASYLQLPLVNKAKEMGIYVICIAWNDDKAVCKNFADAFYDISVINKEELLEVCLKEQIDGITTIATDICIPTIAYVAQKMNLIGNSQKCAELTTDKSAMRNCLQKFNIPIPKSFTVLQNEELDEENNNLRFPLIIKPADRSGSLGVIKVFNNTEAITAINEAIQYSFSKKCVVEEFVEGAEVSVETISYQGMHEVITITDKTITKEPYFVELEHHQPSQLTDDIQQKIRKIAIDVLYATEVKNGASHIEMKINSKGIFVIEIGSRMGGDFIGSDLVFLSTGFDYLKAVIEIALGSYMQHKINLKKQYSGVYFISQDTKHLLEYFDKNEPFIKKKEILSNTLQPAQSSNDRSGYIIYQSDKKELFQKM